MYGKKIKKRKRKLLEEGRSKGKKANKNDVNEKKAINWKGVNKK